MTYTVKEAAIITGYSTESIRRNIRHGQLKAASGGRGDPYKISRTELGRWWKGRGGGELFGDK